MSILLFFIVLIVLVIAHEFGHFIVAKISGMRVDEFGFGFPPKIASIKRGETEYSFNALPFGGFVKIFGEDGEEVAKSCVAGELTEKEASRSFVGQNRLKQAAVVVAAVFFNFLLAWFLLSAGFMIGMPTAGSSSDLKIKDAALVIVNVLPNSPAEEAGILPGDKILALNDDSSFEITEESVQNFIAGHADKEIKIEIKRGEDLKNISITPMLGVIEDHAGIGVSLAVVGIKKLPVHLAIWEGLTSSLKLTRDTAVALFGFARDAFLGKAHIDSLTGPVGLVGIVGDAYRLGIAHLISLTALISINLAIINMIPFPALDGGRLLIILLERIKGSSISPKIVGIVNTFGFILLIILMVVVTYKDIVRIF